MQLHPDFAPNATRVSLKWEGFGYAPLVVTGTVVDRVRAQLASQAFTLRNSPPPRRKRRGLAGLVG